MLFASDEPQTSAEDPANAKLAEKQPPLVFFYDFRTHQRSAVLPPAVRPAQLLW